MFRTLLVKDKEKTVIKLNGLTNQIKKEFFVSISFHRQIENKIRIEKKIH